jgi:uncharacterized membrane protein
VVNDLTDKRPVLVIAITFVIVTVFYWLMKQVTLGLLLKMRQRSSKGTASGDQQGSLE